MKVLLVMPPCPRGTVYPPGVHPRFFPPLGIGYIASMLEKDGHQVTISDLYLQKWNAIFPVLGAADYDIIGITCIFPSRAGVHDLIELVARRYPRAKLLLGGPFATVMADKLAAIPGVTAVAIGEAELTAAELVNAIRDGRPLSEVKGIAFNEGGRVLRTPPRGYIEDLDTVPFPAFHLFDLKSYRKFQPGNFNVVSQFIRDRFTGARWAPVLTTRSCDFGCQFCAVQITCGNRARSRSGINVADEFELLHKKYGYDNIFLQDAAFPVGGELSRTLCAELIKRKIRVNWATNARADMVTRDTLRMMKDAGCSYLLYGLESGAPEILNTINKSETLEQILAAVELSHKAGIKVGVHVLVGYPGESDATITKTIQVLKGIRKYMHTLYVRPLSVFPGTELYRKVLADGHLTENDFYRPSRQFFINYTVEHKVKTLENWKTRIQEEVKPFNFIKRAADFLKQKE
ncbi:MAG: B12-binding domain-containing radical SAM protein [Elusimicrobiales bacterium]|nr:B12-binding domain-containing radical SAM protein [Elusimicrobiales bacterium]